VGTGAFARPAEQSEAHAVAQARSKELLYHGFTRIPRI